MIAQPQHNLTIFSSKAFPLEKRCLLRLRPTAKILQQCCVEATGPNLRAEQFVLFVLPKTETTIAAVSNLPTTKDYDPFMALYRAHGFPRHQHSRQHSLSGAHPLKLRVLLSKAFTHQNSFPMEYSRDHQCTILSGFSLYLSSSATLLLSLQFITWRLILIDVQYSDWRCVRLP